MRSYLAIKVFLLCFIGLDIYAQKETYTWPFGYKRMLTFHGGQMNFHDSLNDFSWSSKLGSISDCNGNLLLYSNGLIIKNGLHDTINNGVINLPIGPISNLLINTKTDSLINLISYNAYGQVIETMINKNGNGKAIKTKISYNDPNEDYWFSSVTTYYDSVSWFILEKFFDRSFSVYQLGDTGINKNLLGNFDTIINFESHNYEQNLKPSPSGNTLVKFWPNVNPIHNYGGFSNLFYGLSLYNFNRATGEVNFYRYIQLPDLGAYSIPISQKGLTAVEFSPNERYLYCFYNDFAVLWQIDLSLPPNHPFAYQYISMPQKFKIKINTVTPLNIQDESREDMLISPYLNALYSPFEVKLAPGSRDTVFLSEIAAPNQPLNFNNFTYKKLNLGANLVDRNNYLPHFPQGLTKTVVYNNSCSGDTIQFRLSSMFRVDSVLWHFGDSASGSENISKINEPTHVFNTPGNYTITTTLYRSGGCTDTILTQFYAQTQPLFNLPTDTFLCEGDTLKIEVQNPSVASYRWLDTLYFGLSRDIIDSGLYIVESFNDCGQFLDSIYIDKIPNPKPNLGNDTTICVGDTIFFDQTQYKTSFLWQNGDTNSQNMATYLDSLVWVECYNVCNQKRDSIKISFHQPTKPNLGSDTAICLNTQLPLFVPLTYDSLIWNNQIKADSLNAEIGLTTVSLFNSCGVFSDTIQIDTVFPLPPMAVLEPNYRICQGDTLTLSASDTFSKVLWSTQDTTQKIHITTAGSFYLRLSNICGVDSIQTQVFEHQPQQLNIKPDTVLCQSTFFQLTTGLSTQNYDSIIWNETLKFPSIIANQGQYRVAVFNACGVFYDTTEVTRVNAPTVALQNDTSLCIKDTLKLYNLQVSPHQQNNWSTGQTIDTIMVSTGQTYYLTVSNACGVKTDSFKLVNILAPQVTLQADTQICFGNTIILYDLNNQNQPLIWNTGDTTSYLPVSTMGEYIALITNQCGTSSDTVHVETQIPINFSFKKTDTLLCKGDTLYLTADTNATDILWSSGNSGLTEMIFNAQMVTIKQENVCGTNFDTLEVKQFPVPQILFNDSYILCPGDSLKLSVNQPLINQIWENNSTNSTESFYQTDSVKIKLFNACHDTLEQEIKILQAFVSDSLEKVKGLLISDYNNGDNLKWYFEGNLIPNQNTESYLPTQAGLHWLTFSDEYGCERIQYAMVKPSEIPTCQTWDIYPNPASDILILKIPGDQLKEVAIYNVLGKLVYKPTVPQNKQYDYQFDFILADGIYYFEAKFDNCIGIKQFLVSKK